MEEWVLELMVDWAYLEVHFHHLDSVGWVAGWAEELGQAYALGVADGAVS